MHEPRRAGAFLCKGSAQSRIVHTITQYVFFPYGHARLTFDFVRPCKIDIAREYRSTEYRVGALKWSASDSLSSAFDIDLRLLIFNPTKALCPQRRSAHKAL